MTKNIIRTKYDYENHPSPGILFDPKKDKLITQQSDMDSADINKIMARYEKTGVLIDPNLGERKPTYGDFTEIKDYHEMMVGIKNVERAFNLLPANTRSRFNNDPQVLIDFLEDPANDKEAVKLGLKSNKVLMTALDLDEKTPTTVEARAELDKYTPEQKIARINFLRDLYAKGIDPNTGEAIPPVIPVPPVGGTAQPPAGNTV